MAISNRETRQRAGKTPPYTPTLLYRFFGWIDRLSIPSWVLVIFVFASCYLALSLQAWRKGLVPIGEFNIDLLNVSLWVVLPAALWYILNMNAIVAIDGFLGNQPAQKHKRQDLLAQFLSVPNIAAIILIGIGMFRGYTTFQTVRSYLPIIGNVFPGFSLLVTMAAASLILLTLFRAIRQGILIRRLLDDVYVSVFNPTPIYALSRYASQSILAILITFIILNLVSSRTVELISEPYFLFTYVVVISTLVFFFFAQLTGINKRMRSEKDKALSEIGLNLDSVNKKINAAVKQGRYSKVNSLRTSSLVLKENWDLVKRIPPWPWEPDTLRNVLLPLLLPVIVYLLQRFAGTLFGL